MNKMKVKVGIPTPWGVTLTSSEFEYSDQVDINKMLPLTYLFVKTSLDNYKKTYRFHLVPFKSNLKQ